jgi:hypothetical protein
MSILLAVGSLNVADVAIQHFPPPHLARWLDGGSSERHRYYRPQQCAQFVEDLTEHAEELATGCFRAASLREWSFAAVARLQVVRAPRGREAGSRWRPKRRSRLRRSRTASNRQLSGPATLTVRLRESIGLAMRLRPTQRATLV